MDGISTLGAKIVCFKKKSKSVDPTAEILEFTKNVRREPETHNSEDRKVRRAKLEDIPVERKLQSKEEHEVHLKLILELLEKDKLLGKFTKCEFCLQEVHFLKHVVNREGVHVDLNKIEAVKNWKPLKTPTEIRLFLGLCGLEKKFERKDDGGLYFAKELGCQYLATMKKDIALYVKILEWKWENITMDFITRLPRTSIGHDAIWVIIDRLTKSAHFLAIHEDYKMERFKGLYINGIVARHSVPVSIIFDHDSRFTSRF
ncbi:putative reverse transcriptase domain-containing protein [Tanacetum coccineum]